MKQSVHRRAPSRKTPSYDAPLSDALVAESTVMKKHQKKSKIYEYSIFCTVVLCIYDACSNMLSTVEETVDLDQGYNVSFYCHTVYRFKDRFFVPRISLLW